MIVSAHDVAREIRRRLPGAGRAKIHKLLYYCQGWHLTWTGQPMFRESVQAWTNGPVVADFWHDENQSRPKPATRPLDDQMLATLDYVVDRYGRFSGVDLIRRTHDEQPWREVSEDESATSFCNPDISHEALVRWFQKDADYALHQAQVDQLRARRDIYSFSPSKRTPELDQALERARRGERVRHAPPG